jgi:hypothetical protein
MKNANLIYWKKGRFLMSSGKTIIIEMDIWLVPEEKSHLYPDGLKFGWIACDKDNPNEQLLVDYNIKKGFHYHVDDEPIVKLEWVSLAEALNFFSEKVHKKFGEFAKEINIF